MKSKRVTAAAVCALTASLALCALPLFSCSQPEQDSSGETPNTETQKSTADMAEEGTIEYWAQKYPNQYASIQTGKMRDGVTHGHDALRSICEAPVARVAIGSGAFEQDEDGHFLIDGFSYDSESGNYIITSTGNPADSGIMQSCVSCKSSRFNELYDQDPLAAFTKEYTTEAAQIVSGQYWDCALCHDGEPGKSLDSNQVYFNAMLGNNGKNLTGGEKACGQCHNSFDYERMVTSGDGIYSFDPYRYGFDADSLLRAALEDGLQSVDEETGIETVMVFHPELEFFQNSTHDSMGLDCTSCHMVEATSDDGAVYTNHDASGSPLENEQALEFCLSCHSSQGIESTEAMADMVRGKQAEAAKIEADMDDKLANLENAIRSAVDSNSASEDTLENARNAYTTAFYYTHYVRGMYADDGVKVAHNPVGTFDLLSRADKLVSDAISELG